MVWDCFKTEKIRPWGLCRIFTAIPMPCNSISFPSTSQNQDYYWNVWSWILAFSPPAPSIHTLNHITVFCWKVSIVTHARCLAAHRLPSEWPWPCRLLAGSEWVCARQPGCVFSAGRPTVTSAQVTTCWYTVLLSTPNITHPSGPTHLHTLLMDYINPLVISISPGPPNIQTYTTADRHRIEFPMMQFIIIHRFIYFLTPRSQLFLIIRDLHCGLYTNQITLHFIKKKKVEKVRNTNKKEKGRLARRWGRQEI